MLTRIVHTRFWQDSFILELSKEARLLFIYVLSNERIGLTGAYECPDQVVCLETGLTKEELQKAKNDLSSKIIFDSGWIAVKNACKYNNYAKNKIHKKAYMREIEFLPEKIKDCILTGKNNTSPLLVSDYSPTSPRLDKNKKQEIRNKKQEIKNRELLSKDKLSKVKISEDKELISEHTKNELIKYLVGKGMSEDIVKQELFKFVSYWTEKNHTGTKERWQLEKTFEVKKRLITWFSNINKFGGKSGKRLVSI